MVRINKNKALCNPTSDVVFKAYRSKYGKLADEDEPELDSDAEIEEEQELDIDREEELT